MDSSIPKQKCTPSKTSRVCVLHFEEKCIITEQDYKTPEGNVQKLFLTHPKLTADAVPTIFPNLPSYLSKATPPSRKNPEERRLKTLERHSKTVEAFFIEDNISNFNEFLCDFPAKLKNILN